ncbi:MAG: prefoldin subunit alpha [Methanosarcinales archaeon]|nr:prefoldin subunit alpha [Methanosarcinales archaeon]
MTSDQNLSEEDIQKMAVSHQQMEYQAQAIAQQINLVKASIDDCNKAIYTITELEGIEEEHEMLIPIGSGANIMAKIIKADKVIIEIGAGVNVEKNLDEARENLIARKEELTKFHEKLQTDLNELVAKMKEIEAIVSSVADKQKQQIQMQQQQQQQIPM